MPGYLLSPESKDDLREIRDYLASRVGGASPDTCCWKLRRPSGCWPRTPKIGHFRRDLTTLPVKFWPVFSYLVVYDPAARPVAIVRVLHGRQDVATILSREPQ